MFIIFKLTEEMTFLLSFWRGILVHSHFVQAMRGKKERREDSPRRLRPGAGGAEWDVIRGKTRDTWEHLIWVGRKNLILSYIHKRYAPHWPLRTYTAYLSIIVRKILWESFGGWILFEFGCVNLLVDTVSWAVRFHWILLSLKNDISFDIAWSEEDTCVCENQRGVH